MKLNLLTILDTGFYNSKYNIDLGYLVNMLILFDAEHFLNMDFSCLYKYMLIVKKEKDIENWTNSWFTILCVIVDDEIII